MNITRNIRLSTIFLLLPAALMLALSACTTNAESPQLQAMVDSLQSELERCRNEEAMIEKRLKRFDSLDFQYYNNQQWQSFSESHDKNIKVVYPDGKVTTGLFPEHIDMLTPMFQFAPDTRIKRHPVSFGNEDWTAVIGEMEGTFSRPMAMGDKTIQPTGKKFKLRMATISKWKDGKMTEEHLFWDNKALMDQIMNKDGQLSVF